MRQETSVWQEQFQRTAIELGWIPQRRFAPHISAARRLKSLIMPDASQEKTRWTQLEQGAKAFFAWRNDTSFRFRSVIS